MERCYRIVEKYNDSQRKKYIIQERKKFLCFNYWSTLCIGVWGGYSLPIEYSTKEEAEQKIETIYDSVKMEILNGKGKREKYYYYHYGNLNQDIKNK